MPFKRIATRLGVSPASVHLWTRDIRLTPEQEERNRTGPTGPHSPERIAKRTAAIRKVHRERRLAAQRNGRERACAGDHLHQAGCMLYWAEGTKDRNALCFANSDPHMVRFFLRFLRTCFGLRPDGVSVRLNVYTGNGLSLREIERHWLSALDLPRSCLRKPILNHFPTSSSGKRRNKLPYGVCTLRVKRSTEIVQHIFGAIQEYGGFEEPRWLDGTPRKPRDPEASPGESPAAPSARGGGSRPGPTPPSARRRGRLR